MTCEPQALVTTRYGVILRVWSDGYSEIAYESGVDAEESLWVFPSDAAQVYGGRDFVTPTATKSDDGGLTWTDYDFGTVTIGALTLIPGTTAFINTINPANTSYYGIEETGTTIWAKAVKQTGPPTIYSYYTSTDKGVTWTFAFDVTLTWPFEGPVDGWLLNSNLWWAGIHAPPQPPGAIKLDHVTQVALPGGGITRTVITAHFDVGVGSIPVLGGWYGCDKLYIYRTEGTQTLETDQLEDVQVVDISGAPTDTVVTAPFGANRYPRVVLPLPDGTAVAHVITGDGTEGELWQSSDGVSTWTKVVDTTTHLASPVGFAAEIIPYYDDPTKLWALGAYPYLYYSTDSGVTWSEVLVDNSLEGADIYWGFIVPTCADTDHITPFPTNQNVYITPAAQDVDIPQNMKITERGAQGSFGTLIGAT